jgi:hypothetical protein
VGSKVDIFPFYQPSKFCYICGYKFSQVIHRLIMFAFMAFALAHFSSAVKA